MVLVTLHNGELLVPPATASYEPLVWADLDDFVAMTRTRDAGRLNQGLDGAFRVRVRAMPGDQCPHSRRRVALRSPDPAAVAER